MRTLKSLRSIASAFALLLVVRSAGAQSAGGDTLTTSSNVLLLVDTSGSMEWKSSGDVDPVCDPANPNPTASTGTNERSRWIELVEVLTGGIQNYSCYAQPRDLTSGFDEEFRLGTVQPYDLGYEAPYHRAISNGCTPGPGDLVWYDTSPYEFQGVGKSAIAYRPFSGSSVNRLATCNTFAQTADGLLDSWEGLVRFGLMTFDTSPRADTGINGNTPDHAEGVRGTWSYMSSPARCKLPATGGFCQGAPADCPTLSPFEVGARNPAAPPWEGRMVPFGPGDDDGRARNAWIQQVLLATRPYGATPIAGMLSDARDFFWNDTADDPVSPGHKLSPYADGHADADPQVVNGCRKNYIILLTDGRPNTDLRPDCMNGSDDSKCPYETSVQIVDSLVHPTQNSAGQGPPTVRTFVVGFATGTAAGGVDCSTMTAAEKAQLCTCAGCPPDEATAACCELNDIAYYGSPEDVRSATTGSNPDCTAQSCPPHAYFARDAASLRASLSDVLLKTLAGVTGRSYPVTGVAASTDPANKGYEFTSGGEPGVGIWRGVLERRRITCENGVPRVQDMQPVQMDDFVANVNGAPDNRKVFTVQGAARAGSTVESGYSIRPMLATTQDDGLGHYSGSLVEFQPSNVTKEALRVSGASWCTAPLTQDQCAARLVDWAAGKTTASPISRCKTPGSETCSVVADIFHSVPQLRSGRPSDLLRDETYAAFAGANATRDTVLYTSSNDGFFHAFLVAPGDGAEERKVGSPNRFNNELWAFIPPAVLPSFQTMYPQDSGSLNRVPALDGVAVIKDVIATQGGPDAISDDCSTTGLCYPFRLERKRIPNTTAGESYTWRTAMVQSFGAQRPGYFATDLTKPTITQTDRVPEAGPKFLWQLTTDDAGGPIFGKGGPTPLITTLFINTGAGSDPNREVAVAVLPGGIGDPAGAGFCDAGVRLPIEDVTASGAPSESTGFRASVQCYPDLDAAKKYSTGARSLTIVRMDTGEVLRTFRPASVALPASFLTGANGIVTDYTWDRNGTQVPLDIPAPIVGQPVAYPAQPGQIADRIFVGDAEGRLWRIDVSDPDPKRWAMNLFFDAYWDQASDGTPKAQPIQTPPIVSVDPLGQLTVAFSTGDQDNLVGIDGMVNYVVSVTEVFDGTAVAGADGRRRYKAKLNWREVLEDGEKVLGPMTLFDKTLFFSTHVQDQAVGCGSLGNSFVWSRHYLNPASANDLSDGASDKNDAGEDLVPGREEQPDAIVSGVGLRQLPSCSTVTDPEASLDELLGFGNVRHTTSFSPASFQLSIQLSGQPRGSNGGGKIATKVIDLPTPNTPVRIDSWAPILE